MRLKTFVVDVKIRVFHGQRTAFKCSRTKALFFTANAPHILKGIVSANGKDGLVMGPCVDTVALPPPPVTFRSQPVKLGVKRPILLVDLSLLLPTDSDLPG